MTHDAAIWVSMLAGLALIIVGYACMAYRALHNDLIRLKREYKLQADKMLGWAELVWRSDATVAAADEMYNALQEAHTDPTVTGKRMWDAIARYQAVRHG